MPRSPDLAIFVILNNDRRQTKPITLPLAHARGINIQCEDKLAVTKLIYKVIAM